MLLEKWLCLRWLGLSNERNSVFALSGYNDADREVLKSVHDIFLLFMTPRSSDCYTALLFFPHCTGGPGDQLPRTKMRSSSLPACHGKEVEKWQQAIQTL